MKYLCTNGLHPGSYAGISKYATEVSKVTFFWSFDVLDLHMCVLMSFKAPKFG